MFLTSFTISVLRGCDWTAAESDGNKQNWNHIAVKKKTKNNNRGSIDSFTEICLLHQSCSDPGEVSEGITGSHVWRSSPARHVSKPDTDCNIHFIPEYKRTISPWNPQTYCASPEQAAVRHDGEWNTKNTNKIQDSWWWRGKKIIPAYKLTFSDIDTFNSLVI